MINAGRYNRTNNLTNTPATLETFGSATKVLGGTSMSKSISGIYAIVNKTNGKYYLGSAVDIFQRWRQHTYKLRKGTHPSKHLQSAWNKYGKDNFEFSIIETVEDVNALIPTEQRYLDSNFPEYNTNRTAGNMLGFRFTEAAKKAMSIAHSRFKHTEESKKKMSDYWKGRPRGKYSEAWCKKISEAHKGKKINANQRAGLRIGQYMPKSAETRRKISDAQKGYKPTEETKRKLSEARKKRVISEETKAKTSASLRRFHENKKKDD